MPLFAEPASGDGHWVESLVFLGCSIQVVEQVSCTEFSSLMGLKIQSFIWCGLGFRVRHQVMGSRPPEPKGTSTHAKYLGRGDTK